MVHSPLEHRRSVCQTGSSRRRRLVAGRRGPLLLKLAFVSLTSRNNELNSEYQQRQCGNHKNREDDHERDIDSGDHGEVHKFKVIARRRATPVRHPSSMLLAERNIAATELAGVTPLAGDQLLDVLRGPRSNRQPIDKGLAGGLRAWLSDACHVEQQTPPSPLVITKKMVAGGTHHRSSACTYEFVRGALVAALFRLVVTCGPSEDPFRDACEMVLAEPHQGEIAAFLASMEERDRRGLARELLLHGRNLAARWPDLLPSWMPRTAVAMNTTFDGGRIVLRGMADLVIGVPSHHLPSVCLVAVKSTPLHSAHRDELRFLGLVETLRSGTAPFRLATYSTLTGEVIAEAVTEELLKNAVMMTIAAIEREGASK